MTKERRRKRAEYGILAEKLNNPQFRYCLLVVLLNHQKCQLAKNKDDIRRWRAENKEKQKVQGKLWHLNNLEKDRAARRKYKALRYATDGSFRILMCLRARMYETLKQNKKISKTSKLLGCSIAECKQHLESQFKPGMTWENHGPVWHIDHKRPCASFDLSEPSQQKECFHYTNLQPLFATENLKKQAKLLL